MENLITNHFGIIAASSVGFFSGMVFGMFLSRMSFSMKAIISIIIIVIWTISMAMDVVYTISNTPLILHAFMGAVIGAANKEFGEFVLKFLGKK